MASEPVVLRPLKSFERWSRIAREPIAWLGYRDAVETQQLETDDELAPLIAAFNALVAHASFAGPFGAADIASACHGYDGAALRRTIEASGCSDATNPLRIGYWLREHRDQVAGRYKLVQAGTHAGSARWRLRQP